MTDRITLGMDGAMDMMATRFLLLNAGSIGAEDDGVTAILPGTEFSVHFRRLENGAEMTRMHYPDGEPMSGLLDLRNPENLMLLMHNVDASLAGLAAPVDKIVRVADRMHETNPQRSEIPSFDLGKWPGYWVPSEDGRQMMVDEGIDVSADVGMTRAPSEYKQEAFTQASLVRWRSQIDNWVLNSPAPVTPDAENEAALPGPR